MPLETQDLKQTAVLWAATATEYDDAGELKRAAPVVIRVRWTFGQTDGRDSQGVKISYDATVIVDRDVVIGSIMWLGTISDYENTSPAPMLYVMAAFTKTPDLKAKYYRRVVKLQKYSRELPALIT